MAKSRMHDELGPTIWDPGHSAVPIPFIGCASCKAGPGIYCIDDHLSSQHETPLASRALYLTANANWRLL